MKNKHFLYICAYIDTQQNAFVTHDILHEMYKYLYLNNQRQKKNIVYRRRKGTRGNKRGTWHLIQGLKWSKIGPQN